MKSGTRSIGLKAYATTNAVKTLAYHGTRGSRVARRVRRICDAAAIEVERRHRNAVAERIHEPGREPIDRLAFDETQRAEVVVERAILEHHDDDGFDAELLGLEIRRAAGIAAAGEPGRERHRTGCATDCA